MQVVRRYPGQLIHQTHSLIAIIVLEGKLQGFSDILGGNFVRAFVFLLDFLCDLLQAGIIDIGVVVITRHHSPAGRRIL